MLNIILSITEAHTGYTHKVHYHTKHSVDDQKGMMNKHEKVTVFCNRTYSLWNTSAHNTPTIIRRFRRRWWVTGIVQSYIWGLQQFDVLAGPCWWLIRRLATWNPATQPPVSWITGAHYYTRLTNAQLHPLYNRDIYCGSHVSATNHHPCTIYLPILASIQLRPECTRRSPCCTAIHKLHWDTTRIVLFQA